ncbi:LOW QUALITY PROTEIN: kinesin-like protein KIF16B [Neosynchiropus ocellatus]
MASVRVAVRVRPMNRREDDLAAKCIIKMEGNKTTITNTKVPFGFLGLRCCVSLTSLFPQNPDGIAGTSARDRTKTFTYDFSYDSTDAASSSFVSQEKVFRDLGSDVLKAAFEGYNACVFAYGQTGSGKSYTMMGSPGDAGLIPRICEGLFSRITDATRWDEASFRTEVSYLEIYNENVRDLLRRKSSQTYNLRVREHPKDGPYVEDLSKHLVQNYSDVEELMEAGNINRTTASTGMNDVSSRSHAIFTINFTQAKFDAEMPSETVSKMHLVDLAGSERADATGATGVRLKEGGNINKSLVTLGNVISALADLSQDQNTNHKKKSMFVPYRDSVLTWLLKDSLGGNSKTIMIANVSPADVNYGETLSTLRYANRAKNIINKPTINEDSNVRLIRELRAEIARLKTLLLQGNQIALLDSPTALSMEEKLHQNEARVLELTKEWTNKWNETQNILKEETLALRKEGIGVVLDSELPHLIGIDDDLLSTGIILYHLKEGRTFVGREDASSEPDIVLHGLDLESEHCIFQNQSGVVTLVPLDGAQCSVNGVQVSEPTPLNQGAVILLGRTNMFRFNHPKEAARLREKRKSGLLSSFSLSMSDLSQSCENLSTVMLYNPGLEFERQQREELEKLELKRRLIKEMEAKQQSEKAELERLQQEVESQRKESEEVHRRILHQEESLRRRSQDIESRLRDFLAEKERFEEERRCEVQEPLRSEAEEQEDEEQRRQQETEIYRELEKLKREREEQRVRLETERRRLEEQEREQLSLVGRLEEQLREKHEVAATLLTRDDARRLEDECRALADIREALLRAKEAGERPDVGGGDEEARAAQSRYTDFKTSQVKELDHLEEKVHQQREQLKEEVASERASLALVTRGVRERQLQLKETQEKGMLDASVLTQEEQLLKQAEQRLQYKERQLTSLDDGLLPALAEEKQRAKEVLERRDSNKLGPPGLDNTLYQVEKELEDKQEKLHLHLHRAQQLQQLQETYEFTANVARQEEKVRRKEKEILESREKQQREAMEQAVARLERRHSALRRSVSVESDAEEQRLNRNVKTADLDQQRVEREIQKLRQRISEGEGGEERSCHSSSPVSHIQSLNTLLPLSDDRYDTPGPTRGPVLTDPSLHSINAYIEEEVQRRLRKMNLFNGGNATDLSRSCESLGDGQKLQSVDPRRLKYESAACWRTNFASGFPPNNATLEADLEEPEMSGSGPQRDPTPVPGPGAVLQEEGWGAEAPVGEVDRRVPGGGCLEDGSAPEDQAVLEMKTEEGTPAINGVHVGPTERPEEPPPEQMGVEPRVFLGRFALGYYTGRLSEVYRDAARRLQDTRDVIRNVNVDEVKLRLTQYVTQVSKDLPLLHRVIQAQLGPGNVGAQDQVYLLNLSKDFNFSLDAGPEASEWPEGSVSAEKDSALQVFHQRLVRLPPALARLKSLSSAEMLQTVGSLAPQVGPVRSVFWIKTADGQQPIPKPCGLFLSGKSLAAVSARGDDLCLRQVSLPEIRTIQISLAGQHVRLIGSSSDPLLVLFTYDKGLSQELCRALMMATSQEPASSWADRPLLSGDLMSLSLDWAANVPDVLLDGRVWVTSRFKRVLADLLYIVHGNMAAPERPSLANVRPLLYTSVEVRNSTRCHQDSIFQFLLTDTHVALLREDGVFHPVPRNSSLVPAQPQVQGLELRRRSDIRLLLVKRSDRCLVVSVVFEGVPEERSGTGSAGRPGLRCDTWKLCFGCTEEAVGLIRHLCGSTQQLVFRSLESSADARQEPLKVSIPRYVLRGQGKDEHFEFEVKVSVTDETWSVFRRYSRFREMHRSLKLKYPELATLDFPPKKLFGNRDERMAAERRSHLERYLRRLFHVMLSSSRSPLRSRVDDGHLSKRDVCEFSPFFKKGVFEYSSHGTC